MDLLHSPGIPGAPPLPDEEGSHAGSAEGRGPHPSLPPAGLRESPDELLGRLRTLTRPATDTGWMGLAVSLARRGWGRVHPNPMVGCVLVRNGELVGVGWHREFGGAHAEVEALRVAGERARGATAYVSLEPCAHQGKTPPCTLALHAAGVARVLFGAADPGRGQGGGEVLRQLGVLTEGPLLDAEAGSRENPAFFAGAAGRGHVTLKLATSLDGRIAARPGVRSAISGEAAARWVHRLRAGVDGILVGIGTVRADDPLLTVRGDVEPRTPPVRIVVDPGATLSPGAALLAPGLPGAVVLLVAPEAPQWRRLRLEEAGARIVEVPSGARGLDLPRALGELRALGVSTLLCEGGGRLAGSLLDAGAVDRLHLLVAPRLIGDEGVPAFSGIRSAVPGTSWIASPPVLLPGGDVILTHDRESGCSRGS